ncbi:MAG: hypothetical protein AAFX87_16810 [Bacteroidota bacterium]
MDQDTVNYVFFYFGDLMTEEEALAYRHYISFAKLEASKNSNQEAKEARRRLYLEKGWLTERKDILSLLSNGFSPFQCHVVERILHEHPDQVSFNLCPNCSKLARTPYVKQCRFCGHDWH